MRAIVKSRYDEFEYSLEDLQAVYYSDGVIIIIDKQANTHTYTKDGECTIVIA